jgi:hypothetical protein
MITKKTINGDTYLRISDLSELSGVNIRTLQRWANAGKLVNFLTIYQTVSGINYFKLGFPKPDDVLIDGSKFKYKLRDDDGPSASNKTQV